MTAAVETGWGLHDGGARISIPNDPADLDAVRAWCGENSEGDFLIVLGRRVVFALCEGAAFATMIWRREER